MLLNGQIVRLDGTVTTPLTNINAPEATPWIG